MENETKVVLRLSSNMVGDDDTSFCHKLLLTNKQVASLHKAFANYLPTDVKLSKTQIPKMIQSGGLLGRLHSPLLKTGLPLMKNVIKPLAKSVLIHVGLTAAASAANRKTHKKILGSGTTTLIISNDGMKDIIRIVKYLEDSGLLLKGGRETIKNEAKEQKVGFLSMLLGTLGHILIGLGINGNWEGIARAGYGNNEIENKIDF